MAQTNNEAFYPFKLQSQTPTQTSSQFNGECFSIKLSDKQEIFPEQQSSIKKQQNKLKYRKLKQKLNNMGSTHDEKCVAVKQIGGPSKQKIMKLAIDFEKQVKMQNRDYYYLEAYSRQLMRYVESRSQQQLHLLRQSRMMPAIFQLCQKVPMLHKNQFNQVLKTLETCFKMIQIFTVLSINRDYLILTNRLNNLISLINWIVGKQDKKSTVANGSTCFYNVQFLCFKIVNVLLNHRSRQQNAENVNSIIKTTLQLVLCSQIFKKVKYAVCQQFIEDQELQQTELIQEMLRFLLNVLRKSNIKKDSIDSLISNANEFSVYNSLKINPELIKTIQFILPSFVSYFIQICDSEYLDCFQVTQINLPNITINILNLTTKILNVCFEVSYVLFKKIFKDIEREQFFTNFLNKIYKLIAFCKRQYEQNQDSNNNIKLLLNQIIVFLGYIGVEDPSIQKKIYETLIFQQISNLPVSFIMDQNLRQIITPTICSLIWENKTTLNFLMKQNSPMYIIKYLRKQIQSKPSLQRKNSTASLMSLAPNLIDFGSYSYQAHRNQLSLRFPHVFWQEICIQLQKHA